MIAFIDEHRGAYGVEPICRVLPIAPSVYHEHVARRADPSRMPARAKCDAELRREVQRVFEETLRVYGVRKVWRQFRAPAPNMLWASDFTYVATWSGFVYVAFVVEPTGSRDIDVFASTCSPGASSAGG